MLPGPEETKEALKEKKQKKALQKAAEDQKLELTEKQARFVQIATDNPEWSDTHIAREAGYSISSKSRASHIVKTIQGKLGPIFDSVFGVTEWNICKTLTEALEATETKYVVTKEYDEQCRVTKEEIHEKTQPNWQARLAAVAKIVRLGGYDPGSKLKVEFEDKNETKFINAMEQAAKLDQRDRQLTQELETDFELVSDTIQ